MGKIFDALEKADRDLSVALPTSNKNRHTRRDNGEEDNVVPLLKPNTFEKTKKLDANLISYHAPQSVEAELFKVLRTNLLFPAEGPVLKTILVTSPTAGDGKSMVSANLSISIAQGVEDYVLLIDTDLRRPTQHSLFGYKRVNGLSEYLKQGTNIANMMLATPIPKLTLIAAGQAPHNPTELLTSKKMKTLLTEVSTRYDDRYIVIDSPPPTMATETTAIAKMVDGVLIVVRKGKTPRNAVSELIDQVGRDKIIGIVFNFSDQSVKKYYGYGKAYLEESDKK
jgi:exopolysaccharide/PEP-CTERM locus tyrosine autokinase